MKNQYLYLGFRLVFTLMVSLQFTLTPSTSQGQTINLENKMDQKYFLQAQIGAEYGIIYGLGYGYQLNKKVIPFWLTSDISLPIGEEILDDFKSRAGIKIQWVKVGRIHISSDVRGIYRRFKNDQVGISNFGMDMNAVAGYYKASWFIAAEAGFDKAIASHFKHSAAYKESFPSVKNGWIEPAMGGNFHYGFQTGWSFKNNDLTLSGGKLLNQDFKTVPLLPFYGSIAFTHKF